MANVIRKLPRIHLVIPDSHAHPDYHNRRYDWLGQLILDVKPDVVVNLGDYADMPSLCSYDKGKKGYEGRRYIKDINAVGDADDRIWHPIKAAKRKLPRRVLTLGNHEDRITRAVESDAHLDGVLSLDDLDYEKNWEVYPFLEVVEVDGIYYSHYFTSGVMGRPIGGEHAAFSLLAKRHVSAICGHTHTYDFCRRNKADGSPIIALVAGSYLDYKADWAGPANFMWVNGVTILRNVEDGVFEHEFIALDTLRKAYG